MNESYYEHPDSYLNGGITRKEVEKLDKYHPNICPHCHGNSGRMCVDELDLYCFICGWRDARRYDIRTIRFIANMKRDTLEILRIDPFPESYYSEIEKEPVRYKQNYNRELRKQYVLTHKNQIKMYKHRYYIKHRKTAEKP